MDRSAIDSSSINSTGKLVHKQGQAEGRTITCEKQHWAIVKNMMPVETSQFSRLKIEVSSCKVVIVVLAKVVCKN